MAPGATTPGRRKQAREAQFFDVGNQGRKTGITLKENVRDENGFEELDGMFSSPEKPKSPARRGLRSSGVNGNVTLTSSSMKVDQSSGPEPTTVLSERRLLKSTNKAFPPPAGRSPYKTNIGSSPRRQSSMAPRSPERGLSSPFRARAGSHPALARRLDFGADSAAPSIEFSPGKSAIGRRPGDKTHEKPRSDIYDLQPSRSPEKEVYVNGAYVDAMDGDNSVALVNEVYDSALDNMADADIDEPVYEDVGEGYEAPREDEEGAEEEQPPRDSPIQTTMKGKGKRVSRLSDAGKRNTIVHPPTLKPTEDRSARQSANSDAEVPDSIAQKRRPGRPRKNLANGDSSMLSVADSMMNASVLDNDVTNPRGRGRPRTNPVDVHRDEVKATQPAGNKRSRPNGGAPSQRDPNVQMIPPSKRAKRSQSPTKPISPSKRHFQPRTLTVLRSETPVDESMHRTRSGRTIIKPLAHWLGERAEFAHDGTLMDIVRAEAIELPRQQARGRSVSVRPEGGRGRGRQRGNVRAESMSLIEEEQDDYLDGPEEWESNGQVLRGPVKVWDQRRMKVFDDEEDEADLAISSLAQDAREVAGGEFKYAKFNSHPFFGTGMVLLPPGGFKRVKNVRKMQMMFFVHEGKITATINDFAFSITKGGVFHVPRGNNYSMRNETSRPARILFAQGCETEVLED